jgi:hypothetical protein
MCVETLQHAALLAPDIDPALVTPSGLHAMLSQPPPGTLPGDQAGVIAALDFAV